MEELEHSVYGRRKPEICGRIHFSSVIMNQQNIGSVRRGSFPLNALNQGIRREVTNGRSLQQDLLIYSSLCNLKSGERSDN